jgi:hypothetical protein
MFDKLNLTFLVISFAIGIFFVYISTPSPQVILKFPSPYNTGKITYKDSSDNCYKYEHKKVDCKTSSNVIPQPITENFKQSSRSYGV